MEETINLWLYTMYTREIEEAKSTIQNEHLWELGYDDEGNNEENPHTTNIETLKLYIRRLQEERSKVMQ